jgi:hypothetical protein
MMQGGGPNQRTIRRRLHRQRSQQWQQLALDDDGVEQIPPLQLHKLAYDDEQMHKLAYDDEQIITSPLTCPRHDNLMTTAVGKAQRGSLSGYTLKAFSGQKMGWPCVRRQTVQLPSELALEQESCSSSIGQVCGTCHRVDLAGASWCEYCHTVLDAHDDEDECGDSAVHEHGHGQVCGACHRVDLAGASWCEYCHTVLDAHDDEDDCGDSAVHEHGHDYSMLDGIFEVFGKLSFMFVEIMNRQSHHKSAHHGKLRLQKLATSESKQQLAEHVEILAGRFELLLERPSFLKLGGLHGSDFQDTLELLIGEAMILEEISSVMSIREVSDPYGLSDVLQSDLENLQTGLKSVEDLLNRLSSVGA